MNFKHLRNNLDVQNVTETSLDIGTLIEITQNILKDTSKYLFHLEISINNTIIRNNNDSIYP